MTANTHSRRDALRDDCSGRTSSLTRIKISANTNSGPDRKPRPCQRVPILSHSSLASNHTTNPSSRMARTAGTIILKSGGVIRGITNWGPFLLTKPKVRAQILQDSGHHFIMRYDCSPEANRAVQKTVAIDPRTLRCGVVKLGSTLAEIADVPRHVPWRKNREDLRPLVRDLKVQSGDS